MILIPRTSAPSQRGIPLESVKIGTLCQWVEHQSCKDHILLRTWGGLVSLTDPTSTWARVTEDARFIPLPSGTTFTIKQE